MTCITNELLSNATSSIPLAVQILSHWNEGAKNFQHCCFIKFFKANVANDLLKVSFFFILLNASISSVYGSLMVCSLLGLSFAWMSLNPFQLTLLICFGIQLSFQKYKDKTKKVKQKSKSRENLATIHQKNRMHQKFDT